MEIWKKMWVGVFFWTQCMWFSYCNCFYCILLYFSLFYHLFYRITVIGWSALAVVSRYCQILLLLLLLQGAARCNCSISCRRLPACLSRRRPSPATIGRHRHVLRSTDQHTARRSELRSRWTTALEQSASQPGFASPTTTKENFVGSWSRFCSIDTAAHSEYFVLMRLLNTLTHSLTHYTSEV